MLKYAMHCSHFKYILNKKSWATDLSLGVEHGRPKFYAK